MVSIQGNRVPIKVVWTGTSTKSIQVSRVIFDKKLDSDWTRIDETVWIYAYFTYKYISFTCRFKFVSGLLSCHCWNVRRGKFFIFFSFFCLFFTEIRVHVLKGRKQPKYADRLIINDRFYLSFFVATRGFRDSGFDLLNFVLIRAKK